MHVVSDKSMCGDYDTPVVVHLHDEIVRSAFSRFDSTNVFFSSWKISGGMTCAPVVIGLSPHADHDTKDTMHLHEWAAQAVGQVYRAMALLHFTKQQQELHVGRLY